ncbi:hypothetical protein LKO27_00860 [Tessaracoccus sp. OS52]|uniref:hypothetical protein n=1 Tax=Tessaracoccus sp. OS52 TaxID=2886691 RepID=UPI001D0F521E|nr:hypothetical protein [Tessaracoccus sp. OS52]MCC2591981.1 hypothetical protein [Tessaracoccus sp. OS52]
MSRRAALLGVAAATVSGCAFEPVSFQPPSPSPSPTASVDPAKVVDSQYFLRSRDGAPKNLPEGSRGVQRIATPHLDATLQAWFTGERLSLETAAQVGETAPLKASDGHELAAFTLRGGVPGYIETTEHVVTSRLLLGDSVIELPNLFDKFNPPSGSYLREWEMFVFSVVEGEPITLQVTDEGKTVSVDLRTGLPTVDDAWRANTGFRDRWDISCAPENGVFKRGFTTMPTAGFDAETGELAVGLQPDTLSGLLPWTPNLGWAPEGHQWLAVPMNVRVQVPTGKVFPQVNLDVPASFLYQDEAGEFHPAVHPATVTTDALARQQVDLIVTWAVTGRDATAQFSFNAVGPIEVDYTDYQNMPAQFTTEAVPLEFSLAYTPRA